MSLCHTFILASNSNRPTRLRYASDENGLPDIQESHRTTLKSKMPDFTERHHMKSEITIKRNSEKKEKGCAIPEQDNVRHLFKP